MVEREKSRICRRVGCKDWREDSSCSLFDTSFFLDLWPWQPQRLTVRPPASLSFKAILLCSNHWGRCLRQNGRRHTVKSGGSSSQLLMRCWT
eukprot:symbB.v1.2.026051.t1/scaffold2571.1/size76067/4